MELEKEVLVEMGQTNIKRRSLSRITRLKQNPNPTLQRKWVFP